MDLLALRYFIAVAEALSFTKAGVRLGISQPALSRHIQELEDSIGANLFLRDSRRVELTPVGRSFLPSARSAIAEFDHALEIARRASKGEIGSLRIAVSGGLTDALEAVLVDHQKRSPGVTIEYVCKSSKQQKIALREREIDIGFLRGPIAGECLNSTYLFSEQLYVLLPKGHKLEQRKSLRLTEISGEPILLPDPERSPIHDKVLALYRNTGARPGPMGFFTDSWLSEAVQLKIRSDERICFATRSVLNHMDNQRIAVALNEPNAQHEVYVASRKNEEFPAALAFLDSVRRVFKTCADKK